MTYSSNVVALDIEVASTCNAACPVCIRRSNGTINDFSQEMRTLSDIKRILGDIIHQIESVQFCGNYGDPMTCAEIHDISEWIKAHGNSTGIRISTNGGIGKPDTYRKLGQLGVEIVWGIDGASKEVNSLHRVHVDFDRVMENMNAYFSDIKPGTFSEWQYILWRENQHEVLPAIKLAEQKGISNFFIRYPNGPTPEMPVVPVFDFYGGFTHWLQQPTNETKFLWDKSFRLDIPLPETTEHEQCVIDLEKLGLSKNQPIRTAITVNGYTHGIPEKIAFDGTLFPYPDNFPYKEHFNYVPWFYNYSASGQISAPERTLWGVPITGANTEAWVTYLICLVFVTCSAIIARNLTRGSLGRKWMAIRDMDIAAEIIGVNPLGAKLSAFAISSFFVGVSGALFFAVYLGAVEVGEVFGINKSFLVLFMIIIGGLGSIFGSFAGAAFLVLLPVFLKNVLVGGLGWPTDLAAHLEFMIVGGLIIVFLIAEPHGIAQLWRITKEKLRLWPFPH